MNLDSIKSFEFLSRLSETVRHLPEALRNISLSARHGLAKLCAVGMLAPPLAACSETGLRAALPDDDDDTTDTDNPTDDDDDTTNQGSTDRGTWFWHTDGVLHDQADYDAATDTLVAQEITSVYNSFSDGELGAPSPAIGVWNNALDLFGIRSDLLIGENNLLCRPDDLDQRIQAFVDFQDAHEAGQRFDGLHLDLEPHALDSSVCPGYSSWDETSQEDRAYMLGTNFTYILRSIREKLEDSGQGDTRVIADLPVWFDQLYDPENNTGIWNTSADRDTFFPNIASSVDGVTLLAYCRGNADSIESSVEGEIAALPDDFHTRLGLNAEETVGGDAECETWVTTTVREYVEEELASEGWPVDVHSLDALIAERAAE